MSDSANIRVLMVEDSDADVELALSALQQGGFSVTHGLVRTPHELEAALDGKPWDAVLCKFNQTELRPLREFETCRARKLDIPFFILAETINPEFAADLMRLGVADVVLKENLSRLAPALSRELLAAEERRATREARAYLAATEQRLQSIASHLPGSMYRRVLRPDGSAFYEYIDRKKLDGFGVDAEPLFTDARRLADFIHPDDIDRIEAAYARSAATLAPFDEISRVIGTDGSTKWFRSLATPRRQEGGAIAWDGISLDITAEIEAKKAFDDERNRIAQIAENMPGHIFRRTQYPDGRIMYSFVGESIHRRMGFSNEEIANNPGLLLERTHPDDRGAWEDGYAVSARDLTPLNVVRRVFAADGSIMWTQAAARPQKLDDGTIVWDGVVLDLTEAKAAEATYREHRRMITSIAENLPGNLFRRTQSPDGGVKYTLAGFKLSGDLGLTQEIVDANPNIFVERTHPEDRAVLAEAYAQSARDMSRVDNVRRIIRPDGKISWVRTIAQPTRLEGGNVVWDGIVLDVTGEQIAAQEARQSQEALDAVADRVPGIIYQRVMRADGGIELPYVSNGLEPLAGFTPEEAAKDPSLFRALIYPDDLARFNASLAESARTMQPLHHEFRIVDRTGTIRWVHDSGRPRPYGDGGIIWDSVLLDITAEREASRALQETQAQLANIAANMPGVVYQRTQFPDGSVRYKFVGNNLSEDLEISQDLVEQDPSYFFNITHPDDKDAVLEAYERSARDLSQLDLVRRVFTPEGKIRWMRATAHPHEGPDGKIVWNGIGLDVTAEQEAILESRERQQILDSLAENIPGVIFQRLLRPDGTIEYPFLSRGTVDIYGYLPEEIAEDPEILRWTDDPTAQEAHDAAFLSSAETLETWTWEGHIRRRDGKRLYVQAVGRPRRIDDGDIIWDGFIFDLTDRYEAEEEVKRARRYLENVLEHMAQGVVTLDEDLKIVHRNKQINAMGRFDVAPGMPYEDAVRQALGRLGYDPSRIEDVVKDRVASARAADGRPVERRTPSGDAVEVRHMRIPGEGYVLTFTDVTERLAAEQELRDNEERFRRLSEDCDIGILMTGAPLPNGAPELLFCNRAFVALFGYDSTEEIEAMPSRHALFSDAARGTIDRLAEERLTGERRRFNVELEGRRKDGSVVWVDMRGTVISWRGETAALCLFFDITERKLAEQELRKLFRTVEQSPDGIVIFNKDFGVEYANPKFTEITGFSWTEVLGMTTTDLFGRLYQMGRPEGLGDALERGVDWSGEYIGQRRDGDYFWFRETVAPIFGDDGALTHWIFIGEDITDFKNVQSDLVHASKLTTLGEMAASLTHELNQPLNVIRMAADACLILAEDGIENPEFMLEQFGTISEQTQRMAEIIRHMRVFSRKEEESAEVQPLEVVENSVGLIKDELRLANVELRLDLPETCPPIRGYPVRVEQVLVNLLTNARDAVVSNAAPPNGTSDRIGWVEIAMAHIEDVNSIVLSVRDSGGGIPDKALPKIFESFYTTKPSGKGTGLGLSVAQSIIRDMGGQISVTNTDDGAEFRITFPVLRKNVTKRTSGS